MADALFDDAELGDIVPALERLQKLAPPSAFVSAATPEQWQELEHSLGLQLPVDFKQLVDSYGNGRFADFLSVCDPWYKRQHPHSEKSYLAWVNVRLTGLKPEWRTYPEYLAPFLPYPAPEGLLPCGFTDNGDTLCWQTTGVSDFWPLVIVDYKQSEQYERYHMTITEFLAQWLHGRIEPKMFPDDIFPAEEPLFRPSDND